MSYSSTVAQKQLDYGFLLLTHIVCADGQIHSEESKYLRELGDRANINPIKKRSPVLETLKERDRIENKTLWDCKR